MRRWPVQEASTDSTGGGQYRRPVQTEHEEASTQYRRWPVVASTDLILASLSLDEEVARLACGDPLACLEGLWEGGLTPVADA